MSCETKPDRAAVQRKPDNFSPRREISLTLLPKAAASRVACVVDLGRGLTRVPQRDARRIGRRTQAHHLIRLAHHGVHARGAAGVREVPERSRNLRADGRGAGDAPAEHRADAERRGHGAAPASVAGQRTEVSARDGAVSGRVWGAWRVGGWIAAAMRGAARPLIPRRLPAQKWHPAIIPLLRRPILFTDRPSFPSSPNPTASSRAPRSRSGVSPTTATTSPKRSSATRSSPSSSTPSANRTDFTSKQPRSSCEPSPSTPRRWRRLSWIPARSTRSSSASRSSTLG